MCADLYTWGGLPRRLGGSLGMAVSDSDDDTGRGGLGKWRE